MGDYSDKVLAQLVRSAEAGQKNVALVLLASTIACQAIGKGSKPLCGAML